MIRKSRSIRRRISPKARLSGSFVAFLLIFLTYSAYPYLPEITYVAVPETFQFKAAIVDQLSLTYPNQTFVDTATNILEQAGFTVEYHKGEEVTVPFYKDLGTHGYGLILLRVHTAVDRGGIAQSLFTSESFDIRKYPYQIMTEQVQSVAYTYEDYERGNTYFGINSKFITQTIKGKFWHTIIINMGCAGSKSPIAEAFIQKGAKLYIGWSDYVLAYHTDTATTHLLQHFLIEKQTVGKALENTMKDVGPDLIYGSVLLAYSDTALSYTIQNIVGNQMTTSTETQQQSHP